MKQEIDSYIKSNAHRWAQTTLKTEASRLNNHACLLDKDPIEIYKSLSQDLAPYAVKTTMIRLAEFENFLGERRLKDWIRNNSNLFRNSYVKEKLGTSYEEAVVLIAKIQNEEIKKAALEMLHGGARVSEILTHKKGIVKGKGGKVRELFLKNPMQQYDLLTYPEVYEALKLVGLKPHQLRKLAATRMVKLGFNEAELMRVMGWSTIATASSYLQARRDDEIKRRLNE